MTTINLTQDQIKLVKTYGITFAAAALNMNPRSIRNIVERQGIELPKAATATQNLIDLALKALYK